MHNPGVMLNVPERADVLRIALVTSQRGTASRRR